MKAVKKEQPLKIISFTRNEDTQEEILILDHEKISKVTIRSVGKEDDFFKFLKRIAMDNLNEQKSLTIGN